MRSPALNPAQVARRDSIKRLRGSARDAEVARREALAPRLVWRAVRDAGAQGMTYEALAAAAANDVGMRRVFTTLRELRADGFVRGIRRGCHPMVYVVDLDCRVPCGEAATLGPGYEADMAQFPNAGQVPQ